MKRTIAFVFAIFLASAGLSQAAQQDKKRRREGTDVASARDACGSHYWIARPPLFPPRRTPPT